MSMMFIIYHCKNVFNVLQKKRIKFLLIKQNISVNMCRLAMEKLKNLLLIFIVQTPNIT